jgi:hypothetical protein
MSRASAPGGEARTPTRNSIARRCVAGAFVLVAAMDVQAAGLAGADSTTAAGEHRAIPFADSTAAATDTSAARLPPMRGLDAAIAPRGAGASHWVLQATAVGGWPVAPVAFKSGWRSGFGLGGSLRRWLGTHVQLGFEAEFLQFRLGSVPGGVDVIGGARRFGRLAVPLELHVFEHRGEHRGSIALQVSAGYVHESVESVSGSPVPRNSLRDDGPAYTAGIAFSRRLYNDTRWSLGGRYSAIALGGEMPQHVTLVLGAEMPLVGSRR